MLSFSPLETYLLTTLLFPAAIAGGATWFIATSRHNALRRMVTDTAVESDVHNERLDPISAKNADYLLFSLLFNLTYLTVNPLQVNQLLFHSAIFYAASLIAFLAGLFLVLSFELRFLPRRYSILGVTFAAVGSVVVTATVRFGFAQGSATGSATGSAAGDSTGAAAGLLLGGQVGMILIPIVLVGGAWTLALIAFLADRVADRWTLPFRMPWDRAYRMLLYGILLGWLGIVISLIPTILLLTRA